MTRDENKETSQVDETRRCLNCEAQLHPEGKYCHMCGQPVSTGRLTAMNMGVTILSGITRINSRFLFTLRSLLLRPWKLIAEFINGRRADYVAPVQLLLILLFICLAMPALLGVEPSSPSNIFSSKVLLAGDSAWVSAINYVFHSIVTSETMMYILLLVPTIPVVRVTHRLLGVRRFNVAEYVVACLYLSCFLLALSMVCYVPGRILDVTIGNVGDVEAIIKFIITLSVMCVALYKSFASSRRGRGAKILYVVVCIILCLVFYLMIFLCIVLIHDISFGKF